MTWIFEKHWDTQNLFWTIRNILYVLSHYEDILIKYSTYGGGLDRGIIEFIDSYFNGLRNGCGSKHIDDVLIFLWGANGLWKPVLSFGRLENINRRGRDCKLDNGSMWKILNKEWVNQLYSRYLPNWER